MHVKQQVKDFVHDVKRKFSQKHNRDSTCSTCAKDHCDGASAYSSAYTSGTTDDSISSSSASSLYSTPQRKRLISFLHPRTPFSSPKHHHNVLRRVKRVGSKRYRLSSAPSMPSMHVAHTTQSGYPPETEISCDAYSSVWEQGDIHDASNTPRSSQGDYPDVLDISARSDSTPDDSLFRDSSQSQPLFDPESRSDTSGTLAASTDFKKSISDSDSRFDSVNLRSDKSSVPSSLHSIAPMAEDPEVSPVPSDQDVVPATVATDDEEITLAQSISSSVVTSQVSRINPPPQPTNPTPPSPAPVFIPRLTASSMFLPIPNVDVKTRFVIVFASFGELFASVSPILLVTPISLYVSSPPFEALTNDQSVIPSPHTFTDPLGALLTKYVPAEHRPRRDVVGEYAGRDIHEMVMSNSWRALARMARDRIVASDPEDLGRILDLWSLRLSSLSRLRLTNQASAECTNLFAVLNAVQPTSAPGAFPGTGTLTPSVNPSSPAPTASLSLSPSGLSGLTQLPGTPSQKPSVLPTPQGAHELVHPFELTVFHARVHYWAGDALGYVDALSHILGQCKEHAREEGRAVMQRRALGRAKAQGGDTKSTTSEGTAGDGRKADSGSADEDEQVDDVLAVAEANLSMWLERVARVCLILASQMIEMNDYQAAINLLAPLCTQRMAPSFQPTPSPELHSALARVYLLSGNLHEAEVHFAIAASAAENNGNPDIVLANTALLAAASGDWTRAEQALTHTIANQPGNLTAINNLAVTLLCQGRIKEGIDLLHGALNNSPSSVVVAEPFLFNLSTLYELRSAAAIDKKRELLIKVAQWSGDGLKTSCLKMPSS